MSDRDLLVEIQKLTASIISFLELMVSRLDGLSDLADKSLLARTRFVENANNFISEMKNNSDFDFGKFIKKTFIILRETNKIDMIRNKDKQLFLQKDINGRVITYIPGVDINFGYKHLLEDEKELFWQYFYLFTLNVYTAMRITNTDKINKYVFVLDAMQYLETELAKTGIMFSGKIFNPYIGIGGDSKLGVDHLVDEINDSKIKKLVKEEMSIESILNMMGVSGMIDREKLEAQLKTIDEAQISEATEKISSLLGGDDEMKEVCGTLINDIVGKLKTNGLNNFDDMIKQIASNARGTIGDKKMLNTAKNMKKFVNNSDALKDLKEGGKISGELLRSLSLPLNILDMMQ
jgi:hypothetical protein